MKRRKCKCQLLPKWMPGQVVGISRHYSGKVKVRFQNGATFRPPSQDGTGRAA